MTVTTPSMHWCLPMTEAGNQLTGTWVACRGGWGFSFGGYLDGEVEGEDDEAGHLHALGEAAGRLPGALLEARVRGEGQGGGSLDEGQRQDDRDDDAQPPVHGRERHRGGAGESRPPRSAGSLEMPGRGLMRA